jgi:murein DD-endopeptidase MepM/ murein hydrolase activator NlpD
MKKDTQVQEARITLCILAFIVLGIVLYHVDSSRRLLQDTIQSHEQKLDIILQDYKDLNIYYDSLILIVDSLPLGSPLDTLEVSSKYGWRRSPLREGWQMHAGIDYMAIWSDTVYATGSGVVRRASNNQGYGRCIMIDHAWGYQSTYAHLYRYFVKRGDTVEKGQPIARAGNSGAVTGPHLHYEIRRNGKTADPSLFVLDN